MTNDGSDEGYREAPGERPDRVSAETRRLEACESTWAHSFRTEEPARRKEGESRGLRARLGRESLVELQLGSVVRAMVLGGASRLGGARQGACSGFFLDERKSFLKTEVNFARHRSPKQRPLRRPCPRRGRRRKRIRRSDPISNSKLIIDVRQSGLIRYQRGAG